MKKILLSLFLVSTIVVVKAQGVVLNEIYTDPGSGNSEFFELYNSSGGNINTDCYTIITYYTESPNKTGFYVMDLPAFSVPSLGFFVGAASGGGLTFSVQGTPNATATFSWNDMPASGSITQYERNGAIYTPIPIGNINTLTDFFQRQSGSGAGIHVLVYANGVLVNAFFGGTSQAVIPAAIRAMPDLTVTYANGVCAAATFIAEFDAASIADNRGEYVTPQTGSDNGYIRSRDGQCGAWAKSSNSVKHTPGTTNGILSNIGTLAVSVLYPVTMTNGTRTLTYTVNSGGPAGAYPVTVFVYEDRRPLADENGGTLNIFEAELPNTIFGDRDTSITHYSRTIPSSGGTFSFIIDTLFSPAAYPNPWPDPDLREQRNFFILFQTPQGCFDQILPTTMGGPLPVKLSKFEAKRIGKQDVNLTWQTASEEKNRGFDVQRFIGSGNWESVGFVSSKAIDGMSSSALNYEFNDINTTKGITQYRLKLLDMDGKLSFSQIRSVRGEGQSKKTIVYPNPSNNGKVNVVFEDVNVTRDITLMDMNGRTIKQWRSTTNNNIQIENLNAGFYSIIILNKETGEQSVEKLIINKR